MGDIFDTLAGQQTPAPAAASQPAAQPQGNSVVTGQSVAQPQAPAAQGDIFDKIASDPNYGTQQSDAADPGYVINDVGNKVIVPKEGEEFADTMKRAREYGKTLTQADLDKETATMPKKVAETLIAAPAIGAGGAALLTGAGDLGGLGAEYLEYFGKAGATKIAEMVAEHPVAAKLLAKVLIHGTQGAGAAVSYSLIKSLLGGK